MPTGRQAPWNRGQASYKPVWSWMTWSRSSHMHNGRHAQLALFINTCDNKGMDERRRYLQLARLRWSSSCPHMHEMHKDTSSNIM